MGRNVFSVPIFFIVFRETLEAAIIVSVLLGLVEQIAYEDPALVSLASSEPTDPEKRSHEDKGSHDGADKDSAAGVGELAPALESEAEHALNTRRFVRRMRWQIFLGSALGFFIALAIGAAFIAVWFTKASDLWAKSEELWEGASTTFLHIDSSHDAHHASWSRSRRAGLHRSRYPQRCCAWPSRPFHPAPQIHKC